MNDIQFYDNQIIIGPSYLKKEILNKCNLKYNIKYYDYNEITKLFSFTYKESSLVYLDNKYNYLPEIGNIILNSLYDIDINKEYTSSKLNTLVSIKKDLIENNYILYNKNISSFLVNKNILYIKSEETLSLRKLMDKLSKINNFEAYNLKISIKDNLDIYEFNDLEDEVLFVANKISDLIKNGISLDKIKINKLDKVYNSTLFRIFDYYNIPISSFENNLYSLEDTRIFLNSINPLTEILSINDILDTLKIDDKVKETLVSILNKYVDYKYIKDIYNELIFDLKNTNITFEKYSNVIEFIDYKNYNPSKDEYVFIMGFNQDIIPKIYKDEYYLLDKELKELNIDTSYEKNNLEKQRLYNFINETNNIYISYKINSNFNSYSPSNYIEELAKTVKINKKVEQYNYRNENINKILLGKRLDDFIKYNNKSEDLINLYSSYDDMPYNTYDNRYTKINNETIKKKLKNEISLSFSNTNTFFKCKFRFLLDSIFRLNEFNETTVSQRIGTLFHNVLYTVYKNNRTDYEQVIDEVINESFKTVSNKEAFYIEKYKKALLKLINVLNDNLSKSDYKNTYFEEWFEINKVNDLKVSIVGKIDKIMTFKDDDKTYVIVIDYKTGQLHGDFDKVIYGLDMQLLYYLYLIKNTNKISNPIFTGMYLQPIFSDIMPKDDSKTYDEQIVSNMKLNGYTTSYIDRIRHIDKAFEDNSFIKGMKLKKDGTLGQYAKVLTDKQIDQLLEIVDNNINEVIQAINESDFVINPKRIEKDNIGCEYCTYKDICYMNVNNIVNLQKHKDLDFLGGDNDDSN